MIRQTVNKHRLTLLLSLAIYSFCIAQSGGNNVYDFLNLTNSARVASLGGQQISINDNDLNLVFHNPSLLNAEMNNHLVLNYVPYFADINYGYVSYARSFQKYGDFAAGIHYVDYGQFTRADEYGNKMGNFSAVDYSFNLYHARPILDSLFTVGGTLKFINSRLENYNSYGMALDASINYYNEERLLGLAFVIKNLGAQFKTYYEGAHRESLPFEIQVGITKKLQYAPFRISILAQHLEKPNLLYKTEAEKYKANDPNSVEEERENKFGDFLDNAMRHVIIGLEILPAEYFSINLGYNYKRRQEMKIPEKGGTAGFTWGLGLRVYKFHISYGRARYHLAGASNYFSVRVNLSEFSKKAPEN